MRLMLVMALEEQEHWSAGVGSVYCLVIFLERLCLGLFGEMEKMVVMIWR